MDITDEKHIAILRKMLVESESRGVMEDGKSVFVSQAEADAARYHYLKSKVEGHIMGIERIAESRRRNHEYATDDIKLDHAD